MDPMDKLQRLCKPIMLYLEENHDPYTEIVISANGIKVQQTIIGIPKEKAVNLED